MTPVPSCLGTSDGFLSKTNKAKGLQYLTKDLSDAIEPRQDQTLLIVDGNALYHSLTDIPENFQGVCEKLFKMFPGSSDFIFSTDMYHDKSIKSMERKRRGTSQTYLLKGSSMKRPADWKSFLSNEENKEQLTDMLLDVWSNDSFLQNVSSRKVNMSEYL